MYAFPQAQNMEQFWGLYNGQNSLTRAGVIEVLQEFLPQMKMEIKEEVLDVGCGPGDVTSDILLPKLHPSATLLGVDRDYPFVKRAKETYTNSRLKFQVVDFGSKDITLSLPKEKFFKVFSFYCFHWIKDKRQVMKNISVVLKPGGEALFSLVIEATVFTSWQHLAKMDRWKPYMKDLDEFLSTVRSYRRTSEAEEHLQEAGLIPVVCEARTCFYTYPNIDKLISFFLAVTPFVGNIPESLRDDYRADMKSVFLDNSLCEVNDDGSVKTHYSSLVVLCHKPF